MLILDRAAARTSLCLWPSAAVDCCTSMFIVFSGACPLRNTAIGTKRGLLSSAPAGAGIVPAVARHGAGSGGCRAGVHLVRHGSAGEAFFDNPQLLSGSPASAPLTARKNRNRHIVCPLICKSVGK
jgi:hypothetical protein